jgi:hypothetical protein
MAALTPANLKLEPISVSLPFQKDLLAGGRLKKDLVQPQEMQVKQATPAPSTTAPPGSQQQTAR